MARLARHSMDAILDATRTLVLERGARSATVSAIAQRSGAPVGSLYHRFGSSDRLLVEMWVRAVRRSQASFMAATQHDNAEQAAVNAALSILHFVEEHRDDARLLASFRREDLIRAGPSPELVRELKQLNRPLKAAVRALAQRLFGQSDAASVQRTVFVVIDLPMGVIRRHLIAGRDLPRIFPHMLNGAVRGALQAGSSARRTTPE